jgi:hypothetical protein
MSPSADHRAGPGQPPATATTSIARARRLKEAVMTTLTLPVTGPCHGNNGVSVRAHLLAHLTTGGWADLLLHMGGPMAGHDGDLAQLEGRELDALRREHVRRHGVAWETAEA